MRADWNRLIRPEERDRTGEEWQKGDELQYRREITFLLQESAFNTAVPLYGVVALDEMRDEAERRILTDILPGAQAAILLGFPLTDPWMRVEHAVGSISMDHVVTHADKKLERILFQFTERLENFSYEAVPVQLPVTPSDNPLQQLFEIGRMGAVGKNHKVIINEFGCRVSLGIVVTDAPLFGGDYRYDPFSGSPCGDCTLCLDSCPAGALQQGEYDENICRQFRESEENTLSFSPHSKLRCDICMRVCPLGEAGRWDAESTDWQRILAEERINF